LLRDATDFEGKKSRKFDNIRAIIERKLAMLDAAKTLDDLRSPPGNRCEALRVTVLDSTPSESTTSIGSASDGRNLGRRLSRPSTITERVNLMKNAMRPVHPGEVLRCEFLEPLGMSCNSLATAIGVPANRITQIVAGKRDVTADTALRLARVFGTTAEFWLNLQQAHDLREAEHKSRVALKKIRRVNAPGAAKVAS
jgi:addiction module HigA family antidote